ncbi:hypothetical protein [Nocardioides campestrisoli]|uniref:hypothetical protein n=1 Tax=Nocardioides campestrisoli TaxID=2736757 RepID=UPI0015E6B3C8|nr:hypothetical protein [Nocardioides campestrisoli]
MLTLPPGGEAKPVLVSERCLLFAVLSGTWLGALGVVSGVYGLVVSAKDGDSYPDLVGLGSGLLLVMALCWLAAHSLVLLDLRTLPWERRHLVVQVLGATTLVSVLGAWWFLSSPAILGIVIITLVIADVVLPIWVLYQRAT